MGTAGHADHGHPLDRIRRITACLAGVVLTVGVASATLASSNPRHSRQLALSSTAFVHHPHVVELDLPAASTTIVPPAAAAPSSAPTPAQRGTEALQHIDYPWQHLGFTITFEGPDDGLLGKANCNTSAIEIYVRPNQSVEQLAFVIAFELGHALDCGFMDDGSRSEWASIRGFQAGWRWFPGCVCSEDDYGSGDISMVFAHWLVPDGAYRWRSNLAPPPSPEQMQQLLPYLRR